MSIEIRIVRKSLRDNNDYLGSWSPDDRHHSRYKLSSHMQPATLDVVASAQRAIQQGVWRYEAAHGSGGKNGYTEGCVALADPNGRTAVWYGEVHADVSNIALATIQDALSAEKIIGAIAIGNWQSANRKTSPARWRAQAACRVLHAKAFGYEPQIRDTYFVELWELDPKAVMTASDETLAACAACVMMKDVAGARAILRGQSAIISTEAIIQNAVADLQRLMQFK
jgi:hypothetical protein